MGEEGKEKKERTLGAIIGREDSNEAPILTGCPFQVSLVLSRDGKVIVELAAIVERWVLGRYVGLFEIRVP